MIRSIIQACLGVVLVTLNRLAARPSFFHLLQDLQQSWLCVGPVVAFKASQIVDDGFALEAFQAGDVAWVFGVDVLLRV